MPELPLAQSEKERAAKIAGALDLLHRWGIHTLGQLAVLDRESVGSRLGPVGLELWDRATGNSTRLLQLIAPPESFEEGFEFENEIETIEPLLFILRRFLQQLSIRLATVYLVAGELLLEIVFSDKSAYRRRFTIPEPTNNSEVLFRMLHTHLENYQSDFPIIGVSLKAKPTRPLFQQFNLFETALRDPTRLSETLARLSALLGLDRVGTPVLDETHRPDAFRMESFIWRLPPTGKKKERKSFFGCVLRRFRSPIPVSMSLTKKYPTHLSGPEFQGDVLERTGPYNFSGNWWDDKSWERTEWDLELETGALCRGHLSKGKWALDGIYD